MMKTIYKYRHLLAYLTDGSTPTIQLDNGFTLNAIKGIFRMKFGYTKSKVSPEDQKMFEDDIASGFVKIMYDKDAFNRSYEIYVPTVKGCKEIYENITGIKTYRVEFEDDNFEIIFAKDDHDAFNEGMKFEDEGHYVLNIFEIDENYEIIRTIV